MKNDREIMQALLDGETLINKYGYELKLDSTGSIETTRWPLNVEMEIKQKTININGFEVPEPLRKQPQHGSTFYVVSFRYHSGMPDIGDWNNSEAQNEWLKNGILHSTKDAAQKHIDALLSFTKVGI